MKYIFAILLVCVGYASSAQGGYLRPNTSYGTRLYRQAIDSTLFLPTGCGAPSGTTTLRGSNLKQSAVYMDSCNARVWFFNPKLSDWIDVTAGGGGGGDSVAYVTKDTTVTFADPGTVTAFSVYAGDIGFTPASVAVVTDDAFTFTYNAEYNAGTGFVDFTFPAAPYAVTRTFTITLFKPLS